MTIYIVMIGDYDSTTPDSAFISKTLAEARAELLQYEDKEPTPCAYYIRNAS